MKYRYKKQAKKASKLVRKAKDSKKEKLQTILRVILNNSTLMCGLGVEPNL